MTAAIVAMAWVAMLGGVRAQTRSALSWVREPGAERCIAAPELGQRVQTLSGRDLVAAPDAQVSIEGRIALAPGAGFVATISVSDRQGSLLGTRELRSPEPDCRALDDRVAFVIAVALDPNSALLALPGELSDEQQPEAAALAELGAEPPVAGAPRAPTAEPVRDRVAPAQPAPPRARPGDHLVLGGLAAVTAQAGNVLGGPVSGGVLAQAGATLDGWPLLARVAWWPAGSREIEQAAPIELTLLELGAQGCVPLSRVDRNPVGFELCAGGLATRVRAAPRGWSGHARATWAFGPELAARALARISGPLFVVIGGSLVGRWPHKRFGVDSGRDSRLYWLPPFAGELAAGLELRW